MTLLCYILPMSPYFLALYFFVCFFNGMTFTVSAHKFSASRHHPFSAAFLLPFVKPQALNMITCR